MRKVLDHGRPRRCAVWSLLASLVLAAAWQAAAAAQQPAASEDANGIAKAKSLSKAFRAAAEKVKPTVVKIDATTKPTRTRSTRERVPRDNPFRGTPFEDFFDEQPFPGFRSPDSIPRQGVGSGVIIDSKGIILTNNHVVEGADEVTVELADGRQFTATEIKTDKQSDLAVVRIPAKEPLPAATLGDSDTAEIGDWVLAIGTPFELTGTVSAGIISGKGRALRMGGQRASYLQTDAAINPGNSGGPLANLDGEVIGINTAIASSTGGYQGVGFTIPINLAKWVTKQLIETGNVQRAYLGVVIQEPQGRVAERFGVGRGRGVLVTEVYKDSPAAAAGLQEGDVVSAFADHPVRDPRDLQEMVERSAPGSKQKVDIVREGKPTTLYVVVKPLPKDLEEGATARPRAGREEGTGSAYRHEEIGLEVGELTEELARQLGYQEASGVLITDVDADGIAAQAGLAEGMLILKVGKQSVKSVADFKAAMKGKSLAEGLLLLIRTRSGNRFVELQGS